MGSGVGHRWLGSGVAVASSYSSNSTPSLGTSVCLECGPKNRKDKKRKKKKSKEQRQPGDELVTLRSHRGILLFNSGKLLSYLAFPVSSHPPQLTS